MAAPVAFLKIQWILHKQQLSESGSGNAYELRSCGWTTVVPPSEASCWGSPRKSDRAPAAQNWHRAASCVQPPCHTDQHCWHGVWASIKLYLWSQTAGQTPSHEASAELSRPKFFLHWEKLFQVSPMPSIMQLCWFWLGKQSPISGFRVLRNCG